jgi:anti-sigma regulatory factor (Ser/Thr protein kinase)
MSPPEATPRLLADDAEQSSSLTLRLPRDLAAGAAARRVVRTRFGRFLTGDTLDDVLLVISELVSNAVLHGTGDIELRLTYDGRRITGEVADDGAGFALPARRRPPGQIGGHGLRIVDSIASCWGIHDRAAHVWFEIADRRLC